MSYDGSMALLRVAAAKSHTQTRPSALQDGGFEYKKAIVDSILILIREIPAAKEAGLAHLCEFIEVHTVASIVSFMLC